MSESAGDHDYGDGIVALDLPALKGDTDWQTRRAESLRRRFFEDKGNLRLAKLLRSAPQEYIRILRVMLSETDAKTIIVTLLR
ncbi:MAG: hypothetical protein E7422_06135 [Ruminococcaceae bacterium]|nr:hypothetical protein [Oscillospiraceae bacterium]